MLSKVINLRLNTVIASFFIPCVVGNAIAVYMGVPPFYLNFDLFLSSIFLSRQNKWSIVFGIIIFSLAILFLVARFIGVVFFINIMEIVRAFRFIEYWPVASLVVGSMTILFFCAMLIAVVLLRPGRPIPIAAWAPVLLIVVAYDVVSGRNGFIPSDQASGPNVVTSGFRTLAPIFASTNASNISLAKNNPISHSSLQSAVRDIHANKVVFSIGFESLGWPVDLDRQHFLSSLVGRHFPNYRIELKQESFQGSSLPGEFRVLCGLRAVGSVDPTNVDVVSALKYCIPFEVGNKWNSLAIHGNSGHFYERKLFYPLMGFGKELFLEDIKSDSSLKFCNYVWRAVCDSSVIRIALHWSSAQFPNAAFVHLMTLDTHFPLSRNLPKNTETFRACQNKSIAQEPVCLYWSVVDAALESLAAGINDAERKPDVLVIWGDHSPPFVERNHRALFDPLLVPVFILTHIGVAPQSRARV